MTARFLTPEERELALARLRKDSDAARDEKFTWTGVGKALKDPKIYLYGLGYHTTILPVYTLTSFLPTIITGLGYSAANAQLLTIVPYVVGFVTTMAAAVLSEKARRRAPFIILGDVVGIVGYIILLTSRWPGVSYAGTILVAAGVFPAIAVVVSWPGNNISGQTKRAVGQAFQLSIGNFAAIIGIQLYRPEWSPRNFVGHSTVRRFAIHIVCLNDALSF